MLRARVSIVLVAIMLASGCVGSPAGTQDGAQRVASRKAPSNTKVLKKTDGETASDADDTDDTDDSTTDDATTDDTTEDSTATDTDDAEADFYGKVLGLDGTPVSGVPVKGYRLGGEDPLTATTGDDGTFTLTHPTGEALNVEAAQSSAVKAIKLNVPEGTKGLTLKLAKVGTISGKVKSSAGGVTDFSTVSVSIPGTGYLTTADAAGTFTLTNVPAGTFNLSASSTLLGSGSVTGVVVNSEEVTTAADLVLSTTRPTITSIDPPNGGPGTVVTITGTGFTDPLTVSFGGVEAADVTRESETALLATVPAVSSGAADAVVTVAGVASDPKAFRELKTLTLSGNVVDLPVGGQMSYPYTVVDTEGNPFDSPNITWSVSDTTKLTVDGFGQVTAKALGDAKVIASSGSLKAELQLHVRAEVATVTTLAGAKDTAAIVTTLAGPGVLAVDADGDVLVVDAAPTDTSAKIFKLDTTGNVVRNFALSPDGVAAVSRDFALLPGLAWDADGNMIVVDGARMRSMSVDGTTTKVDLSSPIVGPCGIAVGSDGTVYVADALKNVIESIAADGTVSVLAGSTTAAFADGTATAARFSGPSDLVYDAADNVLYVADTQNHRIRKIDLGAGAASASFVTTLAGSSTAGLADLTGTAAQFDQPTGLALDGDAGILYVADSGNKCIRRINTATKAVDTLVGNDPGIANTTQDGTQSTATFLKPVKIVIGLDGELYVSDALAAEVRKIEIAP